MQNTSGPTPTRGRVATSIRKQRDSTGQGGQDWVGQYRETIGTYQSLTNRLQSLLIDILSSHKIDVIQVEARTKTVVSFEEKINRKGKKYSNPLAEVTDLVALRVITYYREDVETISDIIRSQFDVDPARSIDKSAALEADRFGYSSLHFVATLEAERSALPEWTRYAGIYFEIQLRTALQHAWAAVNHKLDYKSVSEVPAPLRRQLFRLSALFELADEEFSRIKRDSDDIASGYVDKVREGQTHIPLDTSSLVAYLKTSPTVKAFRKRLQARGVPILDPEGTENETSLASDRRDLVRALKGYGMISVSDLDAYLSVRQRKFLDNLYILSEDWDGGEVYEASFIEDHLLQFLLADKQANKSTFRRYYDEEMWPAFSALVEKYHLAA
ncbi:GTP pyrophosphokinase [Micromonospora humida]|uniref:GTP pyrophosphokinase n=1 Tax=Micromonospora humida TaxID=2809018 RepID=UPI0033EE4DB0